LYLDCLQKRVDGRGTWASQTFPTARNLCLPQTRD